MGWAELQMCVYSYTRSFHEKIACDSNYYWLKVKLKSANLYELFPVFNLIQSINGKS